MRESSKTFSQQHGEGANRAHSGPYWVHLVTTLPLLLKMMIPPLRPLKGWLANDAHKGRLVPKS